MPFRKILSFVVLVLLLALGALSLAQVVGLQPEGMARQNAVAAMAPAGAAPSNANRPAVQQGSASPTTVNLADIPVGILDPNNQLDRWKRGEIDLLEQDGLRSAVELAEMRRKSQSLASSPNIQLADSGPTLNAPSAGTGFDSIDYTECCGGGGNVPPDPELAAGPNHVIAVVNVAFEIYDTAGNSLVAPTTFSSFFSADSNCTGVFDPNVLYDEEADRFFMGIDADGTYYCAAVSQTSDPTGAWNIYSFFASNDFLTIRTPAWGRTPSTWAPTSLPSRVAAPLPASLSARRAFTPSTSGQCTTARRPAPLTSACRPPKILLSR